MQNDIRTDKKLNVNYWDEIDDICRDCISAVMKKSFSPIDDEVLSCEAFYLIAEVRELIITELTKNKDIKGDFPFVDENY